VCHSAAGQSAWGSSNVPSRTANKNDPNHAFAAFLYFDNQGLPVRIPDTIKNQQGKLVYLNSKA